MAAIKRHYMRTILKRALETGGQPSHGFQVACIHR